jgi:hypothetical protein
MDELRKKRVFRAVSELGFRAREICIIQAAVATACAQNDMETVHDLAEELEKIQALWAAAYRTLLVVDCPAALHERTSV